MLNIRRFSKYTLVAGVLFVGNMAIAYGLREGFDFSNILATLCGMVVHGVAAFYINRSLVFKSPTTQAKTGLAKVAVMEVGAFVIVLALTWVGEFIFHQTFLVSRIGAAVAALLWLFVLDSAWVFQPTKGEPDAHKVAPPSRVN